LSFQPEVSIDASELLGAELTQRLTAWVDAMPGFMPTVQRILAMSSEMDASPRDLVHVIETDPVVMIKVLKVVNSAHYGYGKNITSVNQAVVLLGFNTIKNLALGIADTGMLPPKTVGGFDAHRYLVHSLTTAAIAKRLAAQVCETDPLDYYIAGLLHDFGKVMIAHYKPSRFRKALDTSLWEGSALRKNLQSITGLGHERICAGLLESWGFKQALVTAIRLQYQPELDPNHLRASLYVANLVSKSLLQNEPAVTPLRELPAVILSLLGGNLTSVLDSIGDLRSVLDDAMANTLSE
jgi:HD-like signal output (HDOD) protein